MRTLRKLPVLSVLAATLFTVGCGGDSGTGPEDNVIGSLSFNYVDGTTSSSYSASGQVQMDQSGEAQFGTWAAGGRPFTNELVVAAFRARTAPRGDVSVIYLPSAAAAGTVTINETCFDNNDMDCPVMYLVLNTPITDGASFDRICVLLNGSVSISAISNQRAQGTFSGQGVCVNAQFSNPTLFTVNNGTFNVPIVQGFDFE